MALGDVISKLSVSLSLETVAFEKGATKSEKRMNQMRRKFSDFSQKITVGAAAIGGAIVGLNKMFGDLAQKAKEIRNSAQVAGEGFEEFQRLAYGAKSVGVEAEKLGDIFKDVRDRIGDFEQTGGGPMADFFENIAPKVGVTAEMFRGLGGKDSLQLYYDSLKKANVSQEDMVFYLEAMASDTTNLIPLLENGGRAWEEFGSKASVITDQQAEQLKKYENAQLAMENAFQRITLALVDSGLIESMADFAEKLGAVAEGFTGVEAAAGATDEELRKTEGWREFGGKVRDTSNALQKFFDDFDAMNARNAKRSREFWGSIGNALTSTGQYFDDLALSANAAMRRLYTGVKTWLQDKLSGAFNWVTDKVKQVENGFAWLYDRVVGNSWIPDMVSEVGQHMQRLDKLMVDPALAAAEKTDAAFRNLASDIRSILDRLFPEAARIRKMYEEIAKLEAGMKRGPNGEAPLLTEEMGLAAIAAARADARGTGRAEPTAGTVAAPAGLDMEATERRLGKFSDITKGVADKTKTQTVRIAESFKDMAEKTMQSVRGLVDAIKGGGFLDILEGAVNLFLQLGSTGLFGKGIANNINSPAFGGARAMGGPISAGKAYLVGERGPELVVPNHGGRVISNDNLGMGGKLQVEVVANNNGFGAIVRNHAGAVVAEAAPTLMQGSAAMANQQAMFQRSRRLA